MPEHDKVSFQFYGGLTSNHELNFYEAGRFMYGAARFAYTIAEYQRSGRVLPKIRRRVDADIRVSTAKPGSWYIDILKIAGEASIEQFVSIPFGVLIGILSQRILPPRDETKEELLKIVKTAIETDRNRTNEIRTLENMVYTQNLQTSELINISKIFIEHLVAAEKGHSTRRLDRVRFILDHLESSRAGEKLIETYADELSSITSEDEEELSSKLRSALIDMCMPLRSSASHLRISAGPEGESVASLDYETSRKLVSETLDKNWSTIHASIKSYDREQGTGQIRVDEVNGPLSFRLSATNRRVLKDRIAEAMKEQNEGQVSIIVKFQRDRNGRAKWALIGDVSIVTNDEGSDTLEF